MSGIPSGQELNRQAADGSESTMFMKSPTIPEEAVASSSARVPSPAPAPTQAPAQAAAKDQKITPFDVEAGVDAEGNVVAMYVASYHICQFPRISINRQLTL